jgi:uncharacterized protein (DUF305 family)
MLVPALIALCGIAVIGDTLRAEPDGRLTSPTAARSDTVPRYTHADVQFMHGMIAHHGQALVMTGFVAARSSRKDVRALAERIDASQKAEIEMMQRWLRERGQEVPAPDAHSAHHEMSEHGLMPGMLTEAELARLEKAKGAGFDVQFLRAMIRHHEGALTMVKNLFGVQGAAAESEIFRFVSDVEADQSAEIRRMTRMLGAAGR